MFRFLSALTLGVAILAYTSPAGAEDKDAKEVKLTGTICCGKCELKESAKCATTIVVEKDKKKTTYWFDADSSKKFHKEICQETKAGTVTGTVKKDGDKMVITVTDLKYTK